jgi:TatD DNase family protein
MPVYKFCDAHCHLESVAGGFSQDILHITSGYSIDSCRRNAAIAKDNENVFLTAGIAPQEAMNHKEIKVLLSQWEDEISRFTKLVAIGEIGLDYHWAKTEEERFLQHEAFISQLVLAERLGLPVVVHTRDAEAQCIDILRNFNIPFMLHCFSGTNEQAKLAISQNARAIVSIPPLRNKERKQFIRDLPLDRLVAESDAPYIGKTPSDAMESIKMIAEIKGVSEDDARAATLRNSALFFKIA